MNEKMTIYFTKSVVKIAAKGWLAAVVFLCGCGDFFATRPTELESKVLLDELSQVRESPYTQNPLPDVYCQPPGRVHIGGGVKLFYFTRHHAVGQLAELVKQQLNLKVIQNPSINQLVFFCTDDTQADLVLQYLEMVDVPPVQVNIDCLILERFGDVTMDWETSLMAENIMGEGATLGEARGTFNAAGNLTSLAPAFPGASVREPDRSNFGLDVGYWIDKNKPGHQVRAVVDLLISRGYLKVLMNPQVETINGQKALVSIKDFAPIEKLEMGKGGASDAYNITEYQWVEDTLTITPFVYADNSIGLTTAIKIGSRSKPEGVVQRSIITERSINVEENRIRPGYSLIIGGMRKTEKRDVIRGVPFLKDLPVLGILFSSRDFEEKGTEIIFILTPSISSGSREHRDVINEIRIRFADPDVKQGLEDILKDPLGSTTYTNIVEKEAAQAEMDQVNAELLRQQTANKAVSEKQLADEAAHEAAKLRQEAERLESQAQKELGEAKKAVQRAETAKTTTEQERARAAELEAQKQQAIKDAENAGKVSKRAQAAAAEASQKAKQQEFHAKQALEEAHKAKEAARIASEKAAQKAKEAAEEKARKEAEEKVRRQAEEKALKEAEEKALREAEEQRQQEQQSPAQQSPPDSSQDPKTPLMPESAVK